MPVTDSGFIPSVSPGPQEHGADSWAARIWLEAGASALDAALADLGGLSALQRQILTLRATGIEEIAVLAESHSSALAHHLARMGVAVLSWREALDEADKLALLSKQPRPSSGTAPLNHKLILALADRPLFQTDSIRKLIASKQLPAALTYQAEILYPLALRAETLPAVLRGWLEAGRAALPALDYRLIAVNDAALLWQMQSGEDPAEHLRQHSLTALRPGVKVTLACEQLFFGPGLEQLLLRLEQTLSFRQACQQLGLSLSKGWKMVTVAETELGFPLLERQQGGAGGGGSALTAAGNEFLQRFRAFRRSCEAYTQESFQEHFADFPLGAREQKPAEERRHS